VNDLNTARSRANCGGTYTEGVVFGGFATSESAATEIWNGTNWTTSAATLSAARSRMQTGPMGTSTSAIAAGGTPVNGTTATEEWSGAAPIVRTFTDS
jgi:hypothetical protein